VNAKSEMTINPISTEIILTQDGSASIFVPELNEQYHSRFGAITESLHIYIGHGLYALHSKNISIFELGFGTGLNAFLTLTEANKTQLKVNYVAIELYPLPDSITNQLNYASRIEGSDSNLFLKLHKTEWGIETKLSGHFAIKKLNQDFSNYNFECKYDLFYFDAFAPMVQPELWTQEIFNKISQAMNPGAILVTYSAMGEIRRRLISAGLEVKRLSGPPGKREILQAHKS
jgi:tRNA U34 5-methylaminomethyl-2-thiouridine-forming methyltransferase MnmC